MRLSLLLALGLFLYAALTGPSWYKHLIIRMTALVLGKFGRP